MADCYLKFSGLNFLYQSILSPLSINSSSISGTLIAFEKIIEYVYASKVVKVKTLLYRMPISVHSLFESNAQDELASYIPTVCAINKISFQ